jgi:hypothetical protein
MTIIIPNRSEKNIDLVVDNIKRLFPHARVIVSNDHNGKGKGWALSQGLYGAIRLPVVFIDGDMDINPREITKLLPYLFDHDVVVGRKKLPKVFKRRFITKLSRLYIRLLFGINFDTQTGIKAFNYIPKWKVDGWASDIEILYRAKLSGKRIAEVPINATVSDSKTVKDLWKTLLDSIKIRLSV